MPGERLLSRTVHGGDEWGVGAATRLAICWRMTDDSIAEHYAQLIGLRPPWQVSRVEVLHTEQEVRIFVACGVGHRLRCPECDRPCGGYDTRARRWRP